MAAAEPEDGVRADLLLGQKTFLVQAYESAVASACGEASWGMPPAFAEWPALVKIIDKRCPRERRGNIDPWLVEAVAEFVGSVKATGEDPKFYSGWAPSGMLRWYNAGRPGLAQDTPVVEEHPLARMRPDDRPMTHAETAAAANAALAAMKRSRGPRGV
jgi:hypothetical protein